MAVVLTVSETLDGSAVNDVLATPGPDNRGVDFGSVINSSYAPITNKTDNTGRKDLFIRHDAVTDEITSVKTGTQEYGVGTSFGYAGGDSAANDFATLKAQGNSSGDSKNNADGLSGGIWIDMNSVLLDTAGSAQFDFVNNGIDSVGGTNGGNDTVRKYGDNNLDGLIVSGDLSDTFLMKSEAMVIDSDQAAGGDATNGYNPSAPVDGEVGINGDTVLGDNAHIKLRTYVRSDVTTGGILQWEYVIVYSFTS